VTIANFGSPRAWREYGKSVYGPTRAVYRHIGDDPERAAALDRDLDAHAARFFRGAARKTIGWEYLLLTARKQS
jgi:hypothetical protein